MTDNAANPFTAEKTRRAQANPFTAEKMRRDQRSGTGVFMENAALTLGDNVLAAPNAILGKLPAVGAAAIQGLGSVATGGDFDFQNRYEQELGRFPASLLNQIPAPKTQEVLQGIKSLPALMPGGDTFTERYDANMAATDERRAAGAEQFPFSAKAGEVGGDVASLLLGRAPFSKGIKKGEELLMAKGPDMYFSNAMIPPIKPGVMNLLDKAVTSQPVRALARGAGRAAETGFEATMLDIVKGDDPLETAAYAAGGQVAGSALLSATKGLLSGGPAKAGLNVFLAAVSGASIIQMLKQATPGGENRVLESIQTSYAKVTFAMLMGALAAAAGAGRLRSGPVADNLPKFADALSTVPRAATLSLVEDWVNGDPKERKKIERELQAQIDDPESLRRGTIQR